MPVLYVLDNMCFSGCCVHISKVILSLRLCLGTLGRAGIVHRLSCFCADLVCSCMPSGCAALGLPDRKRCRLKRLWKTLPPLTQACKCALPLSIFRPNEIVNDSNNSYCMDWTQTWHARQALDLWAQTLTFPCPPLWGGGIVSEQDYTSEQTVVCCWTELACLSLTVLLVHKVVI